MAEWPYRNRRGTTMSRFEDRGARQKKGTKKARKAKKRCLENAQYDCKLDDEPDRTVVRIESGPWTGCSYVVEEDDYD